MAEIDRDLDLVHIVKSVKKVELMLATLMRDSHVKFAEYSK